MQHCTALFLSWMPVLFSTYVASWCLHDIKSSFFQRKCCMTFQRHVSLQMIKWFFETFFFCHVFNPLLCCKISQTKDTHVATLQNQIWPWRPGWCPERKNRVCLPPICTNLAVVREKVSKHPILRLNCLQKIENMIGFKLKHLLNFVALFLRLHMVKYYFNCPNCDSYQLQKTYRVLTLIGMRQGTFHHLSFLEQIFGSWMFIKNFQTIL